MLKDITRTQEVLSSADNLGLILSKESIELISKEENWKEILEEFSSEGVFVVEPLALEKKLARTKLAQVVPEKVEVLKRSFVAFASERTPDFRVMEENDVTGKSLSSGTVDDFLRLFRSKFDLLSTMLKQRHNLSPIPIRELKSRPKNESVDVIGIVNRKWITKKGHVAYEIEDMDSKCIVLVMERDKEIMKKAERILEDNVVGVKGAKVGDDFIIIKDVYWPDMPIRPAKLLDEEIYSCGVSDFHIGSKLCYEEQLQRFFDYLNGKNLSPKQQEKVGRIQYLFVNGDNVAGIGVYPGQFDDLTIKDVYAQYARFEDFMLQVPEYIQVFICPGQHDAVRRAEPQPGIDKEFVPRLSQLKNFHFVSSPSWVETEGLKNLIYHGPSVHDLISSVSFLEMTKPQDGMVELLKKRDLMPKYGGKNPYVPEKKDYMVIKEEPDLVWFGDMHCNGYTTYRGTSIINTGTWEGQSDFQKKLGHVPTPCAIPIINLKNRKIIEVQFLREATEREINE